jgi:hypothetical protein
MTKGFVLTLDAVLAAISALLLSVLIMSTLSATNINYYDHQALSGVGNDLLAIMDLTGIFDTYTDESVGNIEIDLANHLTVLPVNYCGNMTVSIYSYSSRFQLDKQGSAIKSGCAYSKDKDISKVKRLYVDFDDLKYGLSEIELWLK